MVHAAANFDYSYASIHIGYLLPDVVLKFCMGRVHGHHLCQHAFVQLSDLFCDMTRQFVYFSLQALPYPDEQGQKAGADTHDEPQQKLDDVLRVLDHSFSTLTISEASCVTTGVASALTSSTSP